MRFNDLQFADRVSFGFTGFGLYFSPEGRRVLHDRRISVHPFPASALVLGAGDVEKMRTGFYYSIKGTKVGACSQGGGHPDGGPPLIWPVSEFTIAAKYTYEMLTLGLSGSTDEGSYLEHDTSKQSEIPERFDPLSFRLELRIPREAIARALGLPDSEGRSLYETLELCR